MTYYVYMLECVNGRFYTGYTTDLDRRVKEHFQGSSKCKYTRSFPPKALVAKWKIDSGLSIALKVESRIKQLSRQQKQWLVQNPESLSCLIKMGYNE